MTPNPVTVTEDSSFEDALHMMKEKKIRRLPIVNKKGRLVGIANEIVKENGNILSMATFSGKDATDRIIMVKVAGAPKEALLKGLESQGFTVLNAIEISERGYEFRIIDENTRPFVE